MPPTLHELPIKPLSASPSCPVGYRFLGHRLVEVEWDRNLGDNVIILDEYFAKYFYLYRCPTCGYEEIRFEVAYI